MRSVVVLPAPLGPSSPSTCPAWHSRSSASTTRLPPYVLTMPRACRSGVVMARRVSSSARPVAHGVVRRVSGGAPRGDRDMVRVCSHSRTATWLAHGRVPCAHVPNLWLSGLSATAAGAAAGVTLQTGPVSHEGEVPAFRAGVALVSFEPCDGAQLRIAALGLRAQRGRGGGGHNGRGRRDHVEATCTAAIGRDRFVCAFHVVSSEPVSAQE